jgi:CheY-like chemotaxis protein
MGSGSILIVEDEIVVAMSIRSVLESMGYRVAGIAMSGKEAIGLLEGGCPDLILMDITLAGDMDGIELANQINERYSVPVVFLTGYSDENTINRLAETVNYGFLKKPVDERTFKLSIESALKKHSKNSAKNDP